MQCIYEFDVSRNALVAEDEAGSGVIENTREPGDSIALFNDTILSVNTDDCTARYQLDVCPVGAVYADEHLLDGGPTSNYDATAPNEGHDRCFVIQLGRDAFAG